MESLAGRLRGATEVIVVRGTNYDPHDRAHTETLFREAYAASVRRLAESLEPGDGPDDVALMGWPEITFVFFAGRDELARVGYLSGWLRWDSWPGDRPLREPEKVAGWLGDRGYRP